MPAVRPYDATFRQELVERIEHELWLLALYRNQFLSQNEEPNSTTIFTLGDVNEDGVLLSRIESTFEINMSQPSVQNALSRFRVLAFVSAFKIQDMVAEWILEANGEKLWKFFEKKKKYQQLSANNTLHQPPEFIGDPDCANAFWELYKALEPPRGAIIHTGKLTTHPGGTIETEDRRGKVHSFDNAVQAAYIRYVSMVASWLASLLELNDFHRAIIDNDLASLASLHGVSRYSPRSIRFETLRVHVPEIHASQRNPYACEIDVSLLRTRMEAIHPTAPGGELFLAMEVVGETEDREFVWTLPPEMVPRNSLVLREDDAIMQQYLETRMKQA